MYISTKIHMLRQKNKTWDINSHMRTKQIRYLISKHQAGHRSITPEIQENLQRIKDTQGETE